MDQLKRLAANFSVGQRWTILIAAILVGVGVYALSNWERERNFRPLYTSLAPEDASVIVTKLKESATPFRLTANGTTISVPEERVAELRLEMAGAGVPKSGRIGFEIFDKTNFGMTDFAEHVNYRRALEGELERSVMTVAEIEQARVHISLPQESVFLEARQPAKASVLIRIHPGTNLPESAIPAITNLVASAVEGLAPEMVSVLDMRGNLLNKPKRTPGSQGGDQSGSSDSALEYRHRVEQDLTAKLNSTLEPLVGAGRFRAAVSAECDLTSADQSEENLDPTHSVMVTSQKTEDITSPSQHASSASGGVPGTASNLPDPAPRPTTTGGGVSRKTENVSYQTSRLVKHTILPQGAIKKLSVSVLLDQDVRWEGSGPNAKRILAVPTPEKMKTIHDLVAAAAGLDTQRGDQLIVESLPFESTLNLEPPPVFDAPAAGHPKQLTPLEQLKSDPKMMIGLGVGGLVVILAMVFGIRQMMRKPAPAQAYAQAALPAPEASADAVGSGESDTWSPASLSSGGAGSKTPALAAGRVEALTTQLRAAAQKDVQVSAGVLRGWIREENA
jgi:flagellar M-ring protein FliF